MRMLVRVGDDDIAHGRIGISVVVEDGEIGDVGAEDVLRQHQQGLADSVPALQASAATVDAEFRELVGKDRRLRSPESVSGLEAMHGVGRAHLAGLHDKGNQSRSEGEQKNRIAEPEAKVGDHEGQGNQAGVTDQKIAALSRVTWWAVPQRERRTTAFW